MSFYTSLTGLNSATAQLAVTSNNIANVGTSGNALDLAITGDGFFPLRSPDGLQELYTRNGSFTLNDQNNVVNSTGQRLLAASVDSSGKADLSNLSPLVIPPKTSGQAQETKNIQLGLNLPADSSVITEEFERSNPATYNKSTALTVYDSGGNGYLATVYYVKTQEASQASPTAKWQTYFFVGDTQVKPALQQATDSTGSTLFVNKYGDVLPKSDKQVKPSPGTTEMYTLDQLSDTRASTPAMAVAAKLSSPYFASNALSDHDGETVTFQINVDDASAAQTISYELQASDTDPDTLASHLEVAINNKLGTVSTAADRRYGITVAFDADNGRFQISSGSTGDGSSIAISPAEATDDNGDAIALTESLLGISSDVESLTVDPSTTLAVRGKTSVPATLVGEAMTINTTRNVSISSANYEFEVTVDGISDTIKLSYPQSLTVQSLASLLQEKINQIVDSETDRKVTGVTVIFDEKTKQFNFTTGTTGDNSSIQVTGSADWGLANTEMQFGSTSNWIKLSQYTENGALQYVRNGDQTEDPSDLSTDTEWWPIFLDRGELTFDLTGKPVSPLEDMQFETAFLSGGKGALTMSIDFTQSTQYSSPFAVLSQSQDGAPEGELMGLTIGVDGLVSATYSNGSQASLGKIVLANFSSPQGLRQIGDASYLASATSGTAKIGEAGSAGFGSIRAGATERANVDLTQELVDLITAQRNFQANAKAIETSSTMTQAIINLRS